MISLDNVSYGDDSLFIRGPMQRQNKTAEQVLELVSVTEPNTEILDVVLSDTYTLSKDECFEIADILSVYYSEYTCTVRGHHTEDILPILLGSRSAVCLHGSTIMINKMDKLKTEYLSTLEYDFNKALDREVKELEIQEIPTGNILRKTVSIDSILPSLRNSKLGIGLRTGSIDMSEALKILA